MTTSKKSHNKPLREKAEKLLSKESQMIPKMEDKDVKKLVHELQVHQVELEMQNEELREAQEKIEESRSEYSDLYDFAPIGYFTLSPTGEILKVNLTGANLLDIEREKLIRRAFSVFVEEEYRSHFRDHCRNVLKHGKMEQCDLKMKREGGIPFYASLQSILSRHGDTLSIRSAVSDITELKKVQTEVKRLNAELESRIRQRTAELEASNQQLRQEAIERKRTEQALRESEDRYRTLFGTAPDAIVVHRDGRFLDANNETLRLTGAGSFEDLASRGVLDFFRLEDREQSAERLRLAKVESRLPVREATLLRLDGSELAVEFHTARTDFQGASAVQTIIRDITERRRAEDALRKREEVFRTLAEHSPDVIERFDREMRHIYVNPLAAKLHGRPAGAIIGKTNRELGVPEDYWRLWKERIQKVFEIGQAIEEENEFPTTIGKRIYQSRFVPEKTAEGTVTSVLMVSRDITDRKRAEEELRKSETKYRIVADNTYDFEFWMDPQGQFVYSSPSVKRITGYDPEEFIRDQNLYRTIVHPDDRSIFDRHIEDDEKKHRASQVEYRINHADGSIRWIFHACQPIFSDKGDYLGVRGTNRDVTQRKQAEEALRQRTLDLQHLTETLEERVKERTLELSNSNKMLAESQARLRYLSSRLLETQEEERKRLAGEVHDSFGASLSAIKYKIEFMQSQNDPKNEGLEIVRNQVQILIDESRRLQMELRPSILDDFGIVSALGWFLREFHKTYSHMEVINEIDVEEQEIPNQVKTPIFRISQEALNNAAKHSKANAIKLSLAKRGATLGLEIQDNGAGIGGETLNPKEGRGRGLGLASIEERTSLSGGVFTIHSEVGKGTTVRVSWLLNRS